MKVFLTGFMGAGKSAVGFRLAEALDVGFIDLDTAIEDRAGASIGELFSTRGESEFRRLESRVLGAVCEKSGSQIVATGGGTATLAGNRQMMRTAGIIVWLDVPLPVIRRRLEGGGEGARPLYGSDAEVEALYERRLEDYSKASVRIEVTEADGPEATAAQVANCLRTRGH